MSQLLIIETSDRSAHVALAVAGDIVAERHLDEARRHARDLAPAVAALLQEQGWKPRDLAGVIVSRGPGSYTGLRVGIMSAKTLAYATGCALVGIDTFSVIASQAGDVDVVDIVADGQQDKVYVQRFSRTGSEWMPLEPLSIRPFDSWLAHRELNVPITGPGLRKWAARLPPAIPQIESHSWEPRPSSLLGLGRKRLDAGERDDPFALEPLYLRPSSAEEQWEARARGSADSATIR